MTPEQWQQLCEVNERINQIPYDAIEGAQEPPDWWSDIPAPGWSWVCRDYVLAKATALRNVGWDPRALTVIVCWTEPVDEPPQRERHGVLGVDVDGETWILDNRFPAPYRMRNPSADYLWEMRQIPGTTEWQAIT